MSTPRTAWLHERLRVLSRSELAATAGLAIVLMCALVWLVARFLESAPPRRITIASGPMGGTYHRQAQRFEEILARSGMDVEVRITEGAGENLALLQVAGGADVALIHGGVATSVLRVQMLAALYYEPLWIFVREEEVVDQVNQLAGRTIATGREGSGTAAVLPRILSVNGIATGDATFKALNLGDGLRELKAKTVDAVFAVSAAEIPELASTLRDPTIRVVSLSRADAYSRRFPHVSALTLPAGTIDLGRDIPPSDVRLIATKAMLVGKADLHPGVIDLLIDAAREIHAEQGLFETAGEFPSIAPVDLPVSAEAVRYFREGPTFLHRFFPFWVATFIERLIVFGVPIAVVVAPLIKWLPAFTKWRFRERVFKWYRELRRLEVELQEHRGEPPTERWLAELERIRRGAERISIPAEHASSAYALRGHILMVQRVIHADRRRGAGPWSRTRRR